MKQKGLSKYYSEFLIDIIRSEFEIVYWKILVIYGL